MHARENPNYKIEWKFLPTRQRHLLSMLFGLNVHLRGPPGQEAQEREQWAITQRNRSDCNLAASSLYRCLQQSLGACIRRRTLLSGPNPADLDSDDLYRDIMQTANRHLTCSEEHLKTISDDLITYPILRMRTKLRAFTASGWDHGQWHVARSRVELQRATDRAWIMGHRLERVMGLLRQSRMYDSPPEPPVAWKTLTFVMSMAEKINADDDVEEWLQRRAESPEEDSDEASE